MSKQAPFSISIGYLIAVGTIYLITTCAWLYLGQSTQNRTDVADLNLQGQVAQLWGATHQQPPHVSGDPGALPQVITPT